ncbi:hypothetical protein UPYG_G00132090 [Umbra pygmaea]|uniref:Uncharacterized protein n=1 Tax=Umbra pygmaea TaxID=75934 RepID=A0ABD0WTB9_UMBPY
MSDRRKHDSHNKYSTICRRVCKLSQNRLRINQSSKSPKQTQASIYARKSPHTRVKDLETPKRQARSRYTGLNNNADSPGEADVLQDIIWDPTSPSPATTGHGPGNTRVVEISDIVNRIAPKDAIPASVDSPLLKWIGDSAIPCTPEERLPRARKKLTRKSLDEDLMNLARQFDINMQQGHKRQSTDHPINNNINNNCCREQNKGYGMASSMLSAQHEAELNALFDGPTQRISGRLSQGSSASRSPEVVRFASDIIKSSEGIPGIEGTSAPTARGDELVELANCTVTVLKDKDFDDDWEDDDLLNDPFVLEMTQNPAGLETETNKPSGTQTLSTDITLRSTIKTLPVPISSTSCKPPGLHFHSVFKGTSTHTQPLDKGGLSESCPKPKSTSRSTFMLEANPCFKVNMAHTREGAPSPRPPLTVGKGQSVRHRPGSSLLAGLCDANGVLSEGTSEGVTTAPARSLVVAPAQASSPNPATDSAFKDISDDDLRSLFDSESLWNDRHGDDDVLLYQVCDDIERVSNSQGQSEDATTNPDKVASVKTIKTYTHPNSEPWYRNSTHVNFQGWNFSAKAGNVGFGCNPLMSHRSPGSATILDTFPQQRDTQGRGTDGQISLESRTFHTGNKRTVMPRTLSDRTLPNPIPHHTSLLKRHLSDSAAICNKVFVTSQATGRCTAAEIERKKQEAIARRRSRLTSQKLAAPPP